MSQTPLRDTLRVPVESLRWVCDPAQLDFSSTADLPAESAIVGQARAVRALQFGLAINQPGYNIFVSGPPGTGRNTYARAQVSRVAPDRPPPPDWCYVRNFAAADQPIAISLPAGQGRKFRQSVAELITEVREGLRRAFASEAYERARAEAVKRYEQQVGAIWQRLEEQARSRGLSLQRTPTGILTVPVDLQGRPVTEEVFQTLPEADRTRVTVRMQELQEMIN